MGKTSFDIIVIGGGHAGIEASHIACNYESLSTLLITLPSVPIGSTPCNPSIGGVGKGQVVRELDALGGVIGKLADRAGIQFRSLNSSKGHAVQSTRIQVDKEIYSQEAESLLKDCSGLTIAKEKVLSLSVEEEGFSVITNKKGYRCKKLILTTGTFLSGKLHIGTEQIQGGCIDAEATSELAESLRSFGLIKGKFKTGTPARLKKTSVNYSLLEEQVSDGSVLTFHWEHDNKKRFLPQVSCYLSSIGEESLTLIRANKARSPIFNGQIEGIGPRYCPSIEDKANRYPDKNHHHVFIEPEGLDLDTVYPSGVSTSLPKDVQEGFLKGVKGLEEAVIDTYGYAVEYDVIDTTRLSYSLESKDIPGLFFAGQVNGTSGYEEAAAQGFIAGANAALSLIGETQLKLDRESSYIGVLIEDLITNERDEPYRLFTARSENRLFIREDNAVLRMYPYRKQLFLNNSLDKYNDDFVFLYELLMDILNSLTISENDPFFEDREYSIPRRMKISEFVKQAKWDPVELLHSYLCNYLHVDIPYSVVYTVAISFKYAGYIQRAQEHYNKLHKLDDMKVDWQELTRSDNISFECKLRIERIKPTSFGQLKLIDGIRPATLAVVASHSL